MATQESMAIRANAACDRIEALLRAAGVEVAPLPRIMRDREMLRCVQLEKIAEMLARVSLPKLETDSVNDDDTQPVEITFETSTEYLALKAEMEAALDAAGEDTKKLNRISRDFGSKIRDLHEKWEASNGARQP